MQIKILREETHLNQLFPQKRDTKKNKNNFIEIYADVF